MKIIKFEKAPRGWGWRAWADWCPRLIGSSDFPLGALSELERKHRAAGAEWPEESEIRYLFWEYDGRSFCWVPCDRGANIMRSWPMPERS